MNQTINKIAKYLLFFLAIFIPFRELISLYTTSFIKFIPDALIFGLLIFVVIKNKFKLNLKIYDYFYIGFIIIGFLSCFINSVSFLAFVLQVRSISTMYALFYVFRNVNVEKTTYKQIVNILMIVNIILILFSFIEFFCDKSLLFPKVWADNIIYASNFARTYSLMNNPNTFGMFTFMVMFSVYFINKEKFSKKYFIYYVLAFLGIILSASRSTILVLILFIVFLLYESFKKRTIYNLIWLLVLFIISFILSYGLEMIKNIDFTKTSQPTTNISNPNSNQNSNNLEKNNTNDNDKDKNILDNMAIIDRFKETTSGETTANSNINGRIYIIKTGFKIFKDYPIIGTGFGTYGSAASRMIMPSIYEKYDINKGFYSDNEYIKIIVETGIVGTVLFGLFILSLLYSFFKEKNEYKIFMLIAFLFIGMFYNVFEMQVLCFIMYTSFVFLEKDFFKKEINDKKVSILSLHLGFGGVEQVVVNTANMLSDKYEVEIISLYKNKENIPFKINNNVKVTYLTKLISNREEFKSALKNKKIFKVLKEGFKALYIIINKNFFLRRTILESDAKIIISSRYSFSKILNYCGRDNIYKIHHEHTYSVSNEYINSLNRLKNIDYVIPVSMTLYEEYKDKLNTNLVYIPNALNYFPKDNELSKLNNKNLIAIGRCVEEKGFMDLLDVVKKLDDKDVILNLFGDGYQLNLLKEKAKKLKIDKQINFWGFKDQEFIKKYMIDTSLYVMTSFEESFGLVIIEAMSYGIPCVAFDTAQGAKYIINKENGYFINNRNKLEMAKIIKNYFELKNNDKLVMSKNARKTSEEYKYDKIKKVWLNFINCILEVK